MGYWTTKNNCGREAAAFFYSSNRINHGSLDNWEQLRSRSGRLFIGQLGTIGQLETTVAKRPFLELGNWHQQMGHFFIGQLETTMAAQRPPIFIQATAINHGSIGNYGRGAAVFLNWATGINKRVTILDNCWKQLRPRSGRLHFLFKQLQ